ANMLPTVLFEIAAGGVLAAAVVPPIAGLVPERDPADHVGVGADRPDVTRRAAGTPRPADGGHAAEDSPTGRTADGGPARADRPHVTGRAAGTLRPAAGGHAAEDSPTGRTADDGAALADRIVSALLTWTLLGTAVLTVAVIVLAEPLAQLLLATQSSGESGGALGATLLRIFAYQLPLYGLSVVLAA